MQTLNCVLKSTFQDFEIIVVNDGSTDDYTNEILSKINLPKLVIYTIPNGGVAAARNYGIERATGEYIFPLDADDIIHPRLLEKTAHILDTQLDVGIVRPGARFFGEKKGTFKLGLVRYPDYLIENKLHASCLFRKELWHIAKGYPTQCKVGFEDWSFWISLLELGVKVEQLEEPLFFYRKHREGSRCDVANHNSVNPTAIEEIIKCHEASYASLGIHDYRTYCNYKKKFNTLPLLLRIFLCALPVSAWRKEIRKSFFLWRNNPRNQHG